MYTGAKKKKKRNNKHTKVCIFFEVLPATLLVKGKDEKRIGSKEQETEEKGEGKLLP
jgi:hypothetical protein